jgi:transcriptional antiterminator RfaH
MPILPRQPDIYPDDVLDDAAGAAGDPSPADAGRRWVVLYTLSRREKDLMRKLRAAGIPFYCPLVKRRLRSPGGRARVSYVPLFAGYVFAVVDDAGRRAALATNSVARWLPVPDPAGLVADLRSVKRLIDFDRPLTPEALIESGQAVRVRGGPLAGIEGVVVKRKGGDRLVVAVRFLSQGASIELEDVDVERV